MARKSPSTMSPKKKDLTELIDHFSVLCRKEKGAYHCLDYLSHEHQARIEQKDYIQSQIRTSSSAFRSFSYTTSSESRSTVEVWRSVFCEWTFKVIDHFEISREVASISLSYLDRYLSVHTVDMKKFQLAATTSLFLAIKLYEPNTISVLSFIKLNCGNIDKEHIALMENSILWCVPAGGCFGMTSIRSLQD